MTIMEFQQNVADALNIVDALVQGGCRAIAENALTVIHDVDYQLQQAAGVALVVTTPDLTRNGCAKDTIPNDAKLIIRCVELPSVNREQPGHLTALDAAEIVAKALDGDQFNYSDIRQTIDTRTGTLTASVTFNTTINL